jgi:hypothetical protein
MDRVLSYFITDLEVSDVADDERDRWVKYLEETVDYRSVVHRAGVDMGVYGNSFVSVLPSFRRYLACPNQRCAMEAPLGVIQDNSHFQFQWSNFQFIAKCPACGFKGVDGENVIHLETGDKQLGAELRFLGLGECALPGAA